MYAMYTDMSGGRKAAEKRLRALLEPLEVRYLLMLFTCLVTPRTCVLVRCLVCVCVFSVEVYS